MTRLSIILIALVLSGPAHAVAITNDNGGFLHLYVQQRSAYYRSGEEIRIMGTCASGCTMYLNLPNACIGRGVHLMFHAPRDANGDKSEAARKTTEETRLWMLAQYPLWVRDFINAAGGLSKRQLWMGYPIASKHMRTCGKERPAMPASDVNRRIAEVLLVPATPLIATPPIPRKKPLEMQSATAVVDAERLKDLYLREMNARELVQHLQRVAAWTLWDQRAKELAARQVVKVAQEKIAAILRGSNSSESTGAEADAATLVIVPTAVQEPSLPQEFQQEQPRTRKRQNFNLAGNPRTKTRLR